VLRTAVFAIAGLAVLMALSNCSTAILNSNTLNLATTIDDLAVRQVVFNLAKIKNNVWALPSQLQISGGQVSARTNVAPSLTSPLNSALTGTTQVASQVVAATGALTTTTTGINTSNTPNAGASISSTIEDTENWNVVPVQDPEQLRRLRSLYQYGTRQIRAIDLLCDYPIPEIPDKPQVNGGKSDLQILADALKAASAPAKPDTQPGPAKPKAEQAPMNTTAPAPANGTSGAGDNADDADKKQPKRFYVRGADTYSCLNRILNRPVKYVLIGRNPDPAFMNPPGCVLCAYPNKKFRDSLKKDEPIYESRTSDGIITVKPTLEYVPVIVNFDLMPTGSDYNGLINWLFVVKDGEERPLDPARRVGSSNGYTVYTTSDRRFSEFVLAIQEATLQSPELQKTVAPPPPTVQTNPR
jgi:hypothetical protein